ncbi:MAG: hypothetical protein LCH81_03635 [Bacteroidetes bacterium]|nr:hypothetical protein [Bacteroidota bacterium]
MRYFILLLAVLGLFSCTPAIAANADSGAPSVALVSNFEVQPPFSLQAVPSPCSIFDMPLGMDTDAARIVFLDQPGDDCAPTLTIYVGLQGFIISNEIMPFTVTSVQGTSTFGMSAYDPGKDEHFTCSGVPYGFIEEGGSGYIIASDIQPYVD